jgi:hypothetical protein
LIEISVGTAPSQAFDVMMEDTQITLRMIHLSLPDRWNLSVERAGEIILAGQRMVIGVDLFKSFNFKLGALICFDRSTEGTDPGRTDFENRVILVHVTEAEIASVSS